jgi:hypothetical protein
VKKFVIVLLALGAGYAAWRRLSSDTAERDLWSEVTDTLD